MNILPYVGDTAAGDEGKMFVSDKGEMIPEAKLKGFARPNSSSN